jgi:hypothetical protein
MRMLSFLVAAAFPLLLNSVASAQTPAAPAPRAAKKEKEKKPEGPVANLLGFEAIPGGGSRLYVELTKGTTVTQHETAGQIVFILEGVQIRTGNTENSLELYYHNTPVLRAKLRRAKPDRKAKKKERDAELTIELKTNSKPTHRLVDGQKGVVRLEIDFPEESREAPPGGTPPKKS